MRVTKNSPILKLHTALVAAGLAPNRRFDRRSVASVRALDNFVVWEVVQLRPDLVAFHFNDFNVDRIRRPEFFGEVDDGVAWLAATIANPYAGETP